MNYKNIPSIGTVKNKLRDQKIRFTGFKNISDSDLDEIIEEGKKMLRIVKNDISVYEINPRGRLYHLFLSKLVFTNTIEFDRKVLLLILTLDPDLVHLNEYLKLNMIENDTIKEEDNDFVKSQLIEEKKLQMDELDSNIRTKLGFYEPSLITYENLYYNKFVAQDTLLTGIKKNYINTFFRRIPESFEIDEESLFKVSLAVHKYRKKCEMPDLNDLCYQLIYQSNIIELSNPVDQLLFMIFVLDENFELYQIYDNNGNWHNIEQECKERFGFFRKELVQAEITYDKQINKEKTLSIFDKKNGIK